MKPFSPPGRLALVLTLVFACGASADELVESVRETAVAEIEASGKHAEARTNAAFYLRQIDLALSILDSPTPVPMKKRLLQNMTKDARTWQNVRYGERSAHVLDLLKTYEGYIDSGRFWTLGIHLQGVRLAVRAFQ